MNKFYKIFIPLFIAVSIPASAFGSNIKIVLDEAPLNMDVNPIIVNGRTLVPIRVISEQLGFDVKWNGSTREVTILKDAYELTLKVGSSKAIGEFDDGFGKERSEFTLDSPPLIVNGRTLVPLRFISEQMGVEVEWDGENKVVHLGGIVNYTDSKHFTIDINTGHITNFKSDGIKNVAIPLYLDGVLVTGIGENVLRAEGIESVRLHKNIRVVGRYAFAENKIKNLILPEGIEWIEEGAFDSNNLRGIWIPDGTIAIGSYAFTNNVIEYACLENSTGSQNNSFDSSVQILRR